MVEFKSESLDEFTGTGGRIKSELVVAFRRITQASLPYKGLAAKFNQFFLKDNEIKKIDGIHPRIVLGLPQTWPYLDQH